MRAWNFRHRRQVRTALSGISSTERAGQPEELRRLKPRGRALHPDRRLRPELRLRDDRTPRPSEGTSGCLVAERSSRSASAPGRSRPGPTDPSTSAVRPAIGNRNVATDTSFTCERQAPDTSSPGHSLRTDRRPRDLGRATKYSALERPLETLCARPGSLQEPELRYVDFNEPTFGIRPAVRVVDRAVLTHLDPDRHLPLRVWRGLLVREQPGRDLAK